MADENTLNDAEANNFGNDHAAKEGAPAGYVANFNGDEIDGKTYKMGDAIDAGVDAATLAYLTQIGRISPIAEAGDPPAGGEGGTGVGETGGASTASKVGEVDPPLSDAEKADADKLVADNSKDDLLKIASDEKVDGVAKDDNKAEIAARIVAARR